MCRTVAPRGSTGAGKCDVNLHFAQNGRVEIERNDVRHKVDVKQEQCARGYGLLLLFFRGVPARRAARCCSTLPFGLLHSSMRHVGRIMQGLICGTWISWYETLLPDRDDGRGQRGNREGHAPNEGARGLYASHQSRYGAVRLRQLTFSVQTRAHLKVIYYYNRNVIIIVWLTPHAVQLQMFLPHPTCTPIGHVEQCHYL